MLKPVDSHSEAAPSTFDYVELLSPSDLAKAGRLPLVVRVVNTVLTDAVKAGASEVHMEPQGGELLVRFRVDGHLVDTIRLPQHLRMPTISRLKVLGRLDIAVHDRPQEARVRLRAEDQEFDLNISSLPSALGEAVSMRFTKHAAAAIGLDGLGLADRSLTSLRRMLKSPQGMVIVAGAPGSGKMTTLGAASRDLVSSQRKVAAVGLEADVRLPQVTVIPVEVDLQGRVAAGLRAALRQDYDAILLGEMTDQETAFMALEASQNGRLVITTLHVEDATSAIGHLIDLGAEPYQISLSVLGVLAQRLVRQVCPRCAVSRQPSTDIVSAFGLSAGALLAGQWRAGEGCADCFGTGFKGRTTIHELLDVNEELRSLVSSHAPDHLIRDTATRHGMVSMFDDGLAKAALGATTLDEVLRVAPRTERPVAPQTQGAESTSPVDSPTDAPKSVLILEDDLSTQALLRLILEGEGYATEVASDGIDALLALGKRRFDLILSDINMPNLDGMALLGLKNQKRIETPVVFLTAESGEDVEQRCLESGAADFIRKPIKKDVLLIRIRRALS